ncbi:neuraminidase-like domain-containing protein [Chitinophaga sp. HK235]|uniref:Tc toxin subunit A-related protein n=1 Tax=Chitinophaga sp. HK235 TaxID=2952571 RepID=UPI001BA97DFC|nr:neuraminidase-like domain-containing protein [Chitinophaga sp. HK235]
MASKGKNYIVNGSITDKQNKPVSGLKVYVSVTDPENDKKPQGIETAAGTDGKYALTFTADDVKKADTKDGEIEVYISVYDNNSQLAKTKVKCKQETPVTANFQVGQSVVPRYTIQGKAIDHNDKPLSGLDLFVSLTAPKKDNVAGIPGHTDTAGAYTLTFTAADLGLPGEQNNDEITVYVGAYKEGKLLTHKKVECEAGKITTLDMKINSEKGDDDDDDDDDNGSSDYFIVSGEIRNERGELMDNAPVEVFDRDLRTEQSLGKVVASKGKYSVKYKAEQFNRAEKATADIVVKAYDANGGVIFQSPVYFNAASRLEVNINLSEIEYKGLSEWEVLAATLQPLLEGLSPLDLKEDGQFQDVSFLSGETARTPHIIISWIAAWHLAERALRWGVPMDAAIFYGFIRQGQPGLLTDVLLMDVLDKNKAELVKEKVLKELTMLSEDLQRDILLKAFQANYIPLAMNTAVAQLLTDLHAIKLKYAADDKAGTGKGTVGDLIKLTPAVAEDPGKFLAAYTTNKGSMDDLWRQLETDQVYTKEVIQNLKLSFDLGALTRNHIPMVAALQQNITSGTARDQREFALYDANEWLNIIRNNGPDGKPVGYPVNMDGATEEEKQQQFATILETTFERNYPTTAFAGKLLKERDKFRKQMLASGPQAMARPIFDASGEFIVYNPDFDLEDTRVEQYVEEHPESVEHIEDVPATIKEIKAIQRMFRLNPAYRTVAATMNSEIDSAQQVYFMGLERFIAIMKEKNIGAADAKRIFRKAENAYALALSYYGTYNQAVNSTTPAMVPAPVPVSGNNTVVGHKKMAAANILPNLSTLFGSMDYCECKECRSVYSTAAHYVDILRFLNERETNGSSIHRGKKVKQVLLERRPDLGEIELSCENTNTPLPYIDLVNEVLEDAVQPPVPIVLDSPALLVAGVISPALREAMKAKGITISAEAEIAAPDSRHRWTIRDTNHSYQASVADNHIHILSTRQTHLSQAALKANPEYTNIAAYNKLATQVYPLTLPFNLWSLQSTLWLQQMGTEPSVLWKLFQQQTEEGDNSSSTPSDTEIDSAYLNMTTMERDIITDTVASKEPWEFWGLVETGNNIPHPDMPDDITANIMGDWLTVLSHVPLLLFKTGLDYGQLLQLLSMPFINPAGNIYIQDTVPAGGTQCDTNQFVVMNLNTAAAGRIHRFIRLWKKLNIRMQEADMVLPYIDPANPGAGKMLTEPVIRFIAQADRIRARFSMEWPVVLALFRNIDHTLYSVDGTAAAQPQQTLYQQLFCNKLIDAAVFPDHPAAITGPVQGYIPGIIAALGMSERELFLVMKDMELNANSDLDWTILTRIYRISVLSKILSLNIAELLRLKNLWGSYPFASPEALQSFIDLAMKVKAAGFSVAELDYLLAHQSSLQPDMRPDDKTLAQYLQPLRDELQKILNGVVIKPEETPEDYVRSKLGLIPTLFTDASQLKAMAIISGIWINTATEHQDDLITAYFGEVLDAAIAKQQLAPPPQGLAGAARFAWLQPLLQQYLMKMQCEAFLIQKLSALLSISSTHMEHLLRRTIIADQPLLVAFSDTRFLEKQPDGFYRYALTSAELPAIFSNLRLLHKLSLIITKLKIKPEELEWWLSGTNASSFGWPHPAHFPVDNNTTIALEAWLHFTGFFAWKNTLPATVTNMLAWMTAVLSATDNGIIEELAKLTGWEATDITTCVEAFGWEPGVAFRNIDHLQRLKECMQLVRQLGVNAARIFSWADANPAADTAESMKQVLKAKYDLSRWEEIIKPLQDDLRTKKRDALVSWLIAHPNQTTGQYWITENDLYNYFLIDVEMGVCMQTSRLKQAVAAAQLLVQRCLLNLEEDIIARADLDEKWNQWKWMKYYRVWEANRKVFLYPENWLEPELRDEKSPFFRELEEELMQQDVDNNNAEQAYLNYLEKLDRVANLETRAIYNEVTLDEAVLHVFARTRSSIAPEYFYRQRKNGGRWTAWEKIDLDINSNHLMAGVHNKRLFLMWPQFIEKATEPVSQSIPTQGGNFTLTAPDRYWDINLAWSEMKKGKWIPKTIADAVITVKQDNTGGNFRENIAFRIRIQQSIDVRLYSNKPGNAVKGTDNFEKTGKQVVSTAKPQEYLIAANESAFRNNLMQHQTGSYSFYFTSLEEAKTNAELQAAAAQDSFKLLNNISPGKTFTVIDAAAAGFSDFGTFSCWDSHRNYMVDYYASNWQQRQSSAWTYYQDGAFNFYIHYHPFAELFIRELNIKGLKGLLNRKIQIAPGSIPDSPAAFNFQEYYKPTQFVTRSYRLADKTLSYPVEDVDFTYMGAYAVYNWELFFHAPFYIANKLAANQRFEEALEWYHYIFNPVNTDDTVNDNSTPQQRFWITKPFFETTRADYYRQKIESLLESIARIDRESVMQVSEWRNNPFNPHLLARMRTVAYQKNVLIKYIQTILSWADQLFRRNTMEFINEAAQLYVLAEAILGPKPKVVPEAKGRQVKTFYQLEKDSIDAFGNVLTEVENLIPAMPVTGVPLADRPELPRFELLYFGIPHNEKMMTMWDTVSDRLFKIRHCMNIEGQVQQLPLSDQPIDPGVLISAAAAGNIDITGMLADINAPMPLYRFNFMLQRALDHCAEVKSLGAALLSALEKKDAEAFTTLRNKHEMLMLRATTSIRNKQIEEAEATLESLKESRLLATIRRDYYARLIEEGWSVGEKAAFVLSTVATGLEAAVTASYIIGGGLSVIPTFLAGCAGFGGTPTVSASVGGENLAQAAERGGKALNSLATTLEKGAQLTLTAANYSRRAEEWEFQRQLAEQELLQLDKQIVASAARLKIAGQELVLHDKQVLNLEKEMEYMERKFTSQELYNWMSNQLSTLYFQSYQLAFDLAKRTEKCFRYELGLSSSNYIQFGYWDNLRKGLLCGESLHHDLKRLETAYYEQNRRTYELRKHISLSLLDPVALLQLKQKGECFITIPETLFDMDYPGHYFRRIKAVSLSIPCITGPFTTIACTLTLTGNGLRKDTSLSARGKYARDYTVTDPRFRDEITAVQSIAVSHAQQDSGLFEVNFGDERYLPFEGAGAVSTWHIQLNKDFRQFDFNTLTDVVLHMNYTAREGGEAFKQQVVSELKQQLNEMALAENRKGMFRVFDIQQEFPEKWYRFLYPASNDSDQELVLDDLAARLPYFTRSFQQKKVSRIELVARFHGQETPMQVLLSPAGADLQDMTSSNSYPGLQQLVKPFASGEEVLLQPWSIKLKPKDADDFRSLPADSIEKLYLIINYSIA